MVFLTNLNLSKNELQNAVIQPLASAPSGAKQGQIYYNTVDLVLYQYDGTQWKQIGTTYVLPAATSSTLGGVIVGSGLSVDGSGEISVDAISFTSLTNVPTTLSGYGITDAGISGQTVTLGSDTVTVPTATTTTPKMDGTAAVGSDTTWAKGDHIHPTDTTRAPLNSPALTGTPTAPTAANGTNTTQIATTAFVQNTLSYADAMIFKGTIGAAGDSPTVTSLPNTHNAGWTYKVITAGTYASKTCEVGDLIICVKDGTAAADADWTVVQTNIDGAVTGPASSTSGHIPTFNGTSGKVLQDGYGVASSISNDSTTIPTTAAVNSAVTGLIKTASSTISTSQTSATVSYSGTLINAYATMSGSIVQLDKAVTASSVTFSTAANPASAVTCTVVYM